MRGKETFTKLGRIGLVGLAALVVAGGAVAGTTDRSATDIIRSLAPIAAPAGTVAPTDPAATAMVRSKNLRRVKIAPATVGGTVIVLDVDLDRALDFDVFFEYDSARLLPSATRTLAALGEALASVELQPYRFLVAGHTDAAGSVAYNEDLSRRRAAAVRDFLLAAYPIAPSRLVATGFGPAFLRDPLHPLSGENRRVEVLLVADQR